MGLSIEVDATGGLDMLRNLGDGIPMGMDRALELIARRGEDIVQDNLRSSLRNPTGFYQSRIRSEPSGTAWTVNDGGVIYGAWLEGVGSRNRTTRFKGYSSFRRAAQALQREAPVIAEREVADAVRRITG